MTERVSVDARKTRALQHFAGCLACRRAAEQMMMSYCPIGAKLVGDYVREAEAYLQERRALLAVAAEMENDDV